MSFLAPNPDRPLHAALWSSLGAVFLWSFIGCHDRFTWFMEVFPVLLISGILLRVYASFRFTRLVCWLMWAHAVVLMIGGHYTYAEVPLFNWLRDQFHHARNNYDKVGHFMQGFVPAMISREVLIRRGVLKRGPWLDFLVVSLCLAFSAVYELLEWQTAVWTGGKADAFLGTQGDPWDTQKDMAAAFIGAAAALAALGGAHDRALSRLPHER